MALTYIYTLSLHDALPIFYSASLEMGGASCAACFSHSHSFLCYSAPVRWPRILRTSHSNCVLSRRSEEHTSELQSLRHLVCRRLREEKKASRTERAYGAHT